LPIGLLQAQQTGLTDQSNELTTLDTDFTSLQSAVSGIQDALDGSSFQATVSVPTAVSATLSSGATEGVYSINVDSIGAYATSLSADTWDASSTTPNTYNLLVGTSEYSFTPSDNSASTVASTINSQFGSQVQATAVNIGSMSDPDDRISLQSANLGPTALDIQTIQVPSLQTQTAPTSNGNSTSQTTNTWVSTGGPGDYNLVVGKNVYNFSTTDDSAATVENTINTDSALNGMVTASVVDLGTNGNHDYRIQLQSKTTGTTTLDLQKVTSLQKPQTTGELAQYEVDGGEAVQSDSPVVTVSNGVQLDLLAKTTSPVDVTVTRPTSTLVTALTTFTSDYNAAATAIGSQHGQSAGALQGQAILSTLSEALSSISTYSSSGSVNGLASLGLTLGDNGQLTFAPLTLMGTDLSDSSGVTAFLGSATSGFIEAATNALNNLEASNTGIVKMTESNLQTQISGIGTQITNKQNQVAALQLQLQDQMSQADAMISSMEQQSSYLQEMFTAENTDDLSYSQQ
jgi:flagellar capping protein FliD